MATEAEEAKLYCHLADLWERLAIADDRLDRENLIVAIQLGEAQARTIWTRMGYTFGEAAARH